MTMPTPNTEPNTTPTPNSTGYETPTPEPTPEPTPTPTEPELDANGYEITPTEPEEKKPENPAPKEPEAEPKKEDATGYGKEPKEEPKAEPKEEPKDPESEEGKLEAQIDESLGDLPESFSKETIKKFAVDNKLNSEQVKAYVEWTKKEDAQNTADRETAVKEQRAAWGKELVDDLDFGGENFDKSLDRVNKVLHNLMPDTKKTLTDRGGMLPPYIMKDLLRISKTLNPVAKLDGGDPPKPPTKDSGNLLDDMYQ